MTNQREHGLGLLPYQDPRSRNYQIRTLLTADGQLEPRSKTWNLGAQLDQGSSGRCVAYAGAAELAASPVRWDATNDLANVLYELTVKRDVWTENDNGDIYFGTNDVALMITMRQLGFITAFYWCGAGSGQALADFTLALGYRGPVLAGTEWRASMDVARSDGHIVVDPASALRGYHEYLFHRIVIRWKAGTPPATVRPRTFQDVDQDASIAYIRNSWGGFGNGWMTLREVGYLQSALGTCVVPTVRGVTR